MEPSYNPKDVEEKWYRFWESHGLFKPNPNATKGPYCIILPPPNVTGRLHMGHVLGSTIQDALIRRKRMQGFKTLWVPGTDHAGIATQAVVERHLFATTGKRRTDFEREAFLSQIWEWKRQYEQDILNQFRRIGASLDWSKLCFTLDEKATRAVRVMFKSLFDQGLIYRGDYLVNWDPILQTVIADDEVEYEERPTSLWHIRYPVDGGGHITVATTRPETIPGDTAVAVSPKDPRYQHLIGKEVLLPLSTRKIPIFTNHCLER